jgi:hypothetical protein
MAVEACRRAELPDGIRILPEESYAAVFQISSSSYPLVSFRSGYNPFAISLYFEQTFRISDVFAPSQPGWKSGF